MSRGGKRRSEDEGRNAGSGRASEYTAARGIIHVTRASTRLSSQLRERIMAADGPSERGAQAPLYSSSRRGGTLGVPRLQRHETRECFCTGELSHGALHCGP